MATSAVHALLSSLASRGCVPPPLQPHTLLMMAASPEDVSRVRMGMFTPSAVQMCRDLEALWGVRFLIRQSDGGGDEGKADEDDVDDAAALAAPPPEFVLSCRGVGVRGHRKAT